LTLSAIVEKAPPNNMNDVGRHPSPTYALGRARRLREDCSKQHVGSKAKRLKRSTRPWLEARKTKNLIEIEGSKSNSNDSDDGISRGNDDTSRADALDHSNYSKRDDWSIK
jgi:hypothetical protein